MTYSLKADGFEIVENVIDSQSIHILREAVGNLPQPHRGGVRNLLRDSAVVAILANTGAIKSLANAALGGDAFAVRATLFDKSPEANWKVPWHQDTAIAVADHIETPGFFGWSVKDGVPHVHPPAEILEEMVAVRVHLDDCGLENGPLRVLPGSHCSGRLESEQIDDSKNAVAEVACVVRAGGVVMISPLLLHASSPAETPSRRRVIHIEYASHELPNGLRWFEQSSMTALSQPLEVRPSRTTELTT